MISRSRSVSSAAAISIERTTSANSTVTCLYSANRVADARGVPHSLQNLAVGLDCAPQEPQNSPVAVEGRHVSLNDRGVDRGPAAGYPLVPKRQIASEVFQSCDGLVVSVHPRSSALVLTPMTTA